jgi:polar amino acid transport system substrate-binding protein
MLNPSHLLSRAALLAALLLLVLPLAACEVSEQGEGYPPPVRDAAAPVDPRPDTGYPEPGEEGEATDMEDEADRDAGDAADENAMANTGLGGRRIFIGTDATYPPFESEDPDGQIVGFDPDLMALLCAEADCEAEFVATDWTGIFSALAAGEFDALMSAITILPEREENSGATFTTPYYRIGQVVVARIDDESIAGMSDLVGADALVGVQTGTTGDTAATEAGVPEDNMRRFDTIPLAFQALQNGDVDAVVADEPTAANYVGENPDSLRVAGEAFTTEDYGILVPNDDPELLAALNAAIEKLSASGDIARLAEIHEIE